MNAAGTRPPAHDSAAKHVTGAAIYADDIAAPAGTLHVYPAGADRAHAGILSLDLAAVRAAPGVVAVLTAAEIPGRNDVSPTGTGDEPLFAADEVHYHGQPIFAVVAESYARARAAARLGVVEWEDRPAILTIDQAMAERSFLGPARRIQRGQPDDVLASAPHRLSGRMAIGGQEHFYLEGQASLALPQEDGDILVHCSTQHPSEVQHNIAQVLGLPRHAVTVEVRRMGGAFGGKETQAAPWAAMAALAAATTRRPCRIRLDRDDDMAMTGKRHDFVAEYDVGFDGDGRILALDLSLAARCGHSFDLSGAVVDRALFHADNAYFLPEVRLTGHLCRTNTVSNTAFRGFGGPQGMLAIERVVESVAATLGRDPLEVRQANLYNGEGRDVTPYGMRVEDNIAPEIVVELAETSAYRRRRAVIDAFNRTSPVIRRGIALTPVKFGISFTTTHLNQAGALVHVYADGSIQLNHGGTEMGQGLYVKIAQVVADEFGVGPETIRITAATTAKVPNTSATAASSGADLNGLAAQNAARTIRERIAAFIAERHQAPADSVRFAAGRVHVGGESLAFAEAVYLCYFGRVPLSATGFYATPKIAYDRVSMTGRPFYYFAYGAAVTEVAIDTLTGESRVLRVDILHDVGRSLNPAIDRGQIEGGYIQGMGWLTSEELVWDDRGRLSTHAPSTYKIPTCGDRPEDFRVALVDGRPNREETVFRSKAVGEPPLMLAISVWAALWHAVASTGGARDHPNLDAPATPERILFAIEALATGRGREARALAG
jgi:xanthine dehydrogenase large subunit